MNYFNNKLKELYIDSATEIESINKLKDILNFNNNNESNVPCLHEQCPECNGTGNKANGEKCIHFISCPCPKCNPTY